MQLKESVQIPTTQIMTIPNLSTQSLTPQNLTIISSYDDMLPQIIFSLINNTCISTIIALFGMVTNVFNMVIFVHQGLDSSINISFFSTAISDMFNIVFSLWGNICMNPFIDNSGAPVVFTELYYATGGWPSGLACRVTLHFTAYITAERCLCILFPLKIKTLITPKKATGVIAIISGLNVITLVPEYSSIYLSWEYNAPRNTSVLGVAYGSNRPQTQGVTFLLHVILVVIGLCSIIFLTSVLVAQLRRQTKWRIMSSGNSKHRTSLSPRDRKSVRLVIVVATSVVVCYLPLTTVSLVTVFEPEFYIGGKFNKAFIFTWAMIYLFGILNACTNVIIYYKMNSKFRTSFQEIFKLKF